MAHSFQGTATLSGAGYTHVRESAIDTINRVPTIRPDPIVGFSYGYRALDSSDTTFTDSMVTFSTTDVFNIGPGMLVEVMSLGIRKFAHVLSVDVDARRLHIDQWLVNPMEVTPEATQKPEMSSEVLVSEVGPIFAYTVGATTYTAYGDYEVGIDRPIVFTALTYFHPNSRRFPTQYFWDFGDGMKASGSSVTHQFSYGSNSRRVVLRVIDNEDNEWVSGRQIIVSTQVGIGVVHPGIVLTPAP